MSGLRVVPLGGLGEIGLNLLVLETPEGAVAVDCGVMFPDEQMLGVDVVIPDVSYLRSIRDRFRGAALFVVASLDGFPRRRHPFCADIPLRLRRQDDARHRRSRLGLAADLYPILTGALCCFVHAIAGFTNHSLRGLVAGLLGRDYSRSQMTYDLRRLRLHGLIERLPRTNTYVLTPDGARVALFYTKVHGRVLRPLLATADQPPAPIELRRALAAIDRVIADYTDHARLGTAA